MIDNLVPWKEQKKQIRYVKIKCGFWVYILINLMSKNQKFVKNMFCENYLIQNDNNCKEILLKWRSNVKSLRHKSKAN